MNKLGVQLKELREEKKLTLVQLATNLNVTKATINRYETGVREPSLDMLLKLAEFFEVSTDFLLGLEN